MKRVIIFWLEYPLLHISPLIKSISKEDNYEVIVICERDIPEWRKKIGFHLPSFGNTQLFIAPDMEERKRIVSYYSTNRCIHIFHGLRHVKSNYKCFKLLKKKPCYVGLYLEPQIIKGNIKANLRALVYIKLFKTYKKRIDFVLALGEAGKIQYINLGVDESRVFEFEYYVDIESANNVQLSIPYASSYNNLPLNILYVGQLIPIKNLQLLINAIYRLHNMGYNVLLNIVGDGIDANSLKDQVKQLGIGKYVRFHGVIPNESLKSTYINNDIFILPSFFEGWGAVAVEALAYGLALVVSDNVTAKSIIKNDLNGLVFKNNSIDSLVDSIVYMINNSEYFLHQNSKLKRIEYAKTNLSSESGKEKLINILNKIM